MKTDPEISEPEMWETVEFWSRQKSLLRDTISQTAWILLAPYSNRDNIGYEHNQIRPGRSGQLDIFELMLRVGISETEALLVCSLSKEEISDERLRDAVRKRLKEEVPRLDTSRPRHEGESG